MARGMDRLRHATGREAEWEDQSIYIQVTRGPMAVRNHAFPEGGDADRR
jgi:hypothetical protein